MKYIAIIFTLTLFFAGCNPNKTSSVINEQEEVALINLLHWFLEGASINDYQTHELFWADELIYTGSSGSRTTKQDILEGIKNSEPVSESDVKYHAEDIQIQLHGSVSVVAFKLVATFTNGDRSEFYNTGTFIKNDDRWQAIAWQATRIP
jgi:hypothetical protein